MYKWMFGFDVQTLWEIKTKGEERREKKVTIESGDTTESEQKDGIEQRIKYFRCLKTIVLQLSMLLKQVLLE
nr:hypothetical protein [Tanacetum cinerariifolium]